MATTDGRWALVSTSLTAVIAGSIAWLSLSTMPPANSIGFDTANHQLLPYRLFQDLMQSSGGALYAALGTTGNVHARMETAAPTQLDNALAAEQASENQKPSIETHTATLDDGDTLAGALEDAGISANDANAAISALAKVYNPRSLRAGQSFDLTYSAQADQSAGLPSNLSDTSSDNDANGDLASAQPVNAQPVERLLSISFSPTVEHNITVTRAADGSFTANDAVVQLTDHVHRAGATIDTSLYLSAMHAGIPADVVVEMIKMFSYKVDFQRDIRPGDSFQVFYDYYYTPQGQPVKVGNISYAMMKLGNREIALYRYQPNPNEPADYFDAHGQSAKGMLMKTPVDGARITSGFGMRFHPILGYTRMHKGVDFGVPIGTPVMAAGSGTIAFMGWEHGYGKFVLLNNGNGYSTAYAHLSRFAPGLHKGSHVRQAQVIAYSGMTGMATGPHLHYEVRIDGKQVNPITVKIAQGRKLQGRELQKFLAARMHIDATLATTKLETKVADVSSDLRQAAK
ncbi:MAG: M23 family metallopeptidase [Alphaproteobacteria bacterium]|nr:M23 family metallopeptidase [Alphaproteobacteria bacterium]MDE2112361.1 M23 family metallopeptidase [Alphaproteobacteria bacterium]MDE2492789.1 M23 family metallopeptidase [Alphaproteobacteria bacterium]